MAIGWDRVYDANREAECWSLLAAAGAWPLLSELAIGEWQENDGCLYRFVAPMLRFMAASNRPLAVWAGLGSCEIMLDRQGWEGVAAKWTEFTGEWSPGVLSCVQFMPYSLMPFNGPT